MVKLRKNSFQHFRHQQIDVNTIWLQENVNDVWPIDQKDKPCISNYHKHQLDAAPKLSSAELSDRFLKEKDLFGQWDGLKIIEASIYESTLPIESLILQRILEQLSLVGRLKTET